MIKKIKKKINKKTSLLIGIVLFFISGIAYVTDAFKNYHNILLAMGIVMIWLAAGVISPRCFMARRILNPYVLFVCMVGVSFLVHMEKSMIITIAGLILLWWTTCVLLPYSCRKYHLGHEIFYLLLMGSVCSFLIFSFATTNFRITKYEGIFTNPNACGGAAATLCAVTISCFLEFYEGKTWLQLFMRILSLAITVFSCFVALFTTSRTSVITIFVMSAIMMLMLIFGSNVSKRKRNLLITAAVLIVLAVLIYFFTDLRDLVQNIIYKFQYKESNTFDGREERWELIINRLKWFGNGEESSIAAHNTYLSLTDQYGIVAGFFWALFVLFYFLKSVVYMSGRQDKPYRFLPFFSFLCFGLISFTEGMMLKTIMLICIFCTGVLDHKSLYEEVSDEQTN